MPRGYHFSSFLWLRSLERKRERESSGMTCIFLIMSVGLSWMTQWLGVESFEDSFTCVRWFMLTINERSWFVFTCVFPWGLFMRNFVLPHSLVASFHRWSFSGRGWGERQRLYQLFWSSQNSHSFISSVFYWYRQLQIFFQDERTQTQFYNGKDGINMFVVQENPVCHNK